MELREIDSAELKARLLDMLKRFDVYCREQGLRYSLSAGTLLGAVRHGGFIPWDDDVDVHMPRPDLDRLIAKAGAFYRATGMRLRGHLGVPLEIAPLVKVVDERTLVKPQREPGRTPAWIDISPDDSLPTTMRGLNELYAQAQRYHAELNFLGSTPESGSTRTRRLIKRLASPLSRSSSLKRSISQKLTELAKTHPYGSTEYVGTVSWGLGGAHESMSRESYERFCEMEFEGSSFMVMGSWEEYLGKIYGPDYMKLPPAEQRISHIAQAWAVENSSPNGTAAEPAE